MNVYVAHVDGRAHPVSAKAPEEAASSIVALLVLAGMREGYQGAQVHIVGHGAWVATEPTDGAMVMVPAS